MYRQISSHGAAAARTAMAYYYTSTPVPYMDSVDAKRSEAVEAIVARLKAKRETAGEEAEL